MQHQEDDRSITMSEVMTPNMVNFSGNIHGGYLLQMLDRVAYACSARYSGQNVVTLSVDEVMFKEPIHVGELVTCYARVNHVGHTSMIIGIKVIAENLRTKVKRHTNTCYFTMVATDENMKPITIKPLELRNATEKRRFEEAAMRKDMRKRYAQEHQERKETLLKKLSD